MNSIERLRQFVEDDLIYQAYKRRNGEPNKGFERQCFVHCRDIENILKENQQLKEENKKLISVLKIIRHDINFAELCDGYLITEILDKVKK